MKLSKMSPYTEASRVSFTVTKRPRAIPEKQPHILIPFGWDVQILLAYIVFWHKRKAVAGVNNCILLFAILTLSKCLEIVLDRHCGGIIVQYFFSRLSNVSRTKPAFFVEKSLFCCCSNWKWHLESLQLPLMAAMKWLQITPESNWLHMLDYGCRIGQLLLSSM